MKKKLALLTLIAGGLTATAIGTTYNFSLRESGEEPNTFRTREIESAKPEKSRMSISDKNATAARFTEIDESRDYGKEVTILSEDFSKLTTGSEEAPDMNTPLNNYDKDEYPVWFNVGEEFTQTKYWGAYYAYPAGGMLYLDTNSDEGAAKINTPLINVGDNCGIFFVSFKARSVGGPGYLAVEGADTQGMNPTWNFLDSQYATVEEEWQQYNVMFYKGSDTTILNIVAMGYGTYYPVLMDDIRVYQIEQYVDTPTATGNFRYKGTETDLTWTAVEGAESYLVDVYGYDEIGAIDDEYPVKDAVATTNSYHATGLESGRLYNYTVRAVKGEHQSYPSYPKQIWDIESPVLDQDVTLTESGNFIAQWNEVPTAERYNYWAYYKRTAEEDGPMVLTDEDFTGITNGDGEIPVYTLENTSSGGYDDFYIKETKQQGWHIENGQPNKDFVAVDGYFYYYQKKNSALLSPEMDLSKDGGKFTINCDLAGESILWEDNLYYFPRSVIALFNYNEETEDYDQVEMQYIDDVEGTWQNYNYEFTKGSSRSIIGIFAVYAPGNIYIDNVKITQNYKKDEFFLDPFVCEHWLDSNKLEVLCPYEAKVADVYHRAVAVKARATSNDYNTSSEFKESLYSDMQFARGANVKVEQVKLDANKAVSVEGNVVTVANFDNNEVVLYNVNGEVVNSGYGETVTFTLNNRGVYIVKAGKTYTKVIY
jgi:hypothetical protein